jgi:hypothetical protein
MCIDPKAGVRYIDKSSKFGFQITEVIFNETFVRKVFVTMCHDNHHLWWRN